MRITTFFDHIFQKKLIRISQADRYVLSNCRRLGRFLDKEYTIDSENLKLFLTDQVDTIKSRLSA